MQGPDIVVIHVDDALLVLEKPSGLLCVPGRGEEKQDCLSARTQVHFPDALVVHRLDMATSGLLLMARGATAQQELNHAFASRSVHKRYVAVVDGLLEPPTKHPGEWGIIDLPILLDWPNRPRRIVHPDGKPSTTCWRVISQDRVTQTTRVELEPITGRSHQLRLHLQTLNHPILADALYGTASSQAKADRLLLHATQLELLHPVSQKKLVFSSSTPF